VSLFETYTSALGGTGTSASRFAQLALEMVRSKAHGGIAGMLDKFRDSGLDDAVRSWLSTGRNLAITKEDIERVFSKEQLGAFAAQAGVSPDIASTELASLIPQIIDKLSPGGHLPEGEQLNQLVGALKEKIGML
jgi:uncharacterized protein YidB (DUF937 family)